MNVWNRTSRRFVVIIVALLAITGLALAQGGPTPITPGQNLIGEVTTGNTTFVLASAGGETVDVQLYTLTPGFNPFLRVLSPTGGELMNQVAAVDAAALGGTVPLAAPGNYTIEVSSSGGAGGQFMVSVQPGAALPQPAALGDDQPQIGELSAENPLQTYRFNTTAQSGALLTLAGSSAEAAPQITVRDSADGHTVAMTDASVVSAAFQFAPGDRSYIVEIQHTGVSVAQPYSLCAGAGTQCWRVIEGASYMDTLIGSEGLTATAFMGQAITATVSMAQTLTAMPPTEAATACRVASSTGGTVNVRRGPGTNADIIGALVAGQTLAVTGTVPDASWYQVDQPGSVGWVGATVVQLQGNCAGVPVVGTPLPPMLQAPAPTQPPAPTVAPTEPSPANLVVGLPDLVISSATATIDPNGGTTVVVTVSNIGTAEAGPNELQVQYPDSNIEQRMIGPLAPGASTTQTFSNSAALAAGDWQANVDAIGVIEELSDSNNHAEGFVQYNA